MITLELNPKQTLAVNHLEGPLLVLAGAGSGKTRVVTCRIAKLIELGVPPSDILGLTFTNKAAGEMRERVRSMTDQNVWISTFHSLGARLLRESIHALGFNRDFSIYDDKDSDQLIKTCLKSLDFKEEKSLVKAMRHAISSAKNELISPQKLNPQSMSREDLVIKEVYTLYQEKLKEYNALDFDDLLFLPVELFKSHPDILAAYQKKWSFLLIDEYQDTNKAQYELSRLLVARHNNIFVVGDPDQSIYSWRGANIQNILNFENDFPGAQIITLDQNYRSTTNILDAANALIEQNESRYEKELWSDLGQGAKIGVNALASEHEEARFVVEKLLDHHVRDGIALNQSVIFYRTNAQSRTFEDALLKREIPYIIIGGISFYQRREIKDILSLLRMVVSSSDFLAFARTINLPKRGIGNTTLAKLRTLTEELGMPILNLCREIRAGNQMRLSKKQMEGIADYLQTIDTLREMCNAKAPLDEIIKRAIEDSHYLDYLKEDAETMEDRRENLNELIVKAAEWKEESQNPTLLHFLEELTLRSSADDAPIHDSVRLMTLHNGKGLEFDLTFLVGMEEDLFPHVNSKDTQEALEEERRLCYVGMTRAKKFLYLSSSSYRLMWGVPRMMRHSRFLDEIPPQYLDYIGQKEEEEFEENLAGESAYHIGAQVHHKSFGRGTILKAYNTSLGLTYDVQFQSPQVTRSLVAKYAKFKLVN